MSDAPTISVVMPVYNGQRFLPEAIDSVLAQTCRDFELIVVDDGSTDGTGRISREYAARDKRVRPLRLDVNVGMGGARNAGIRAARGAYIAAMDADDISLPQRLQTQLDCLRHNPDIGLCTVQKRIVKQDLSFSHQHDEPRGHAMNVLHMFMGLPCALGNVYLARREVMEAVGGYDEGRRRVADFDLYARLFEVTRIVSLPQPLYWRRLHADMGSTIHQTEARAARASLRAQWLARLWGEAPSDFLALVDRLKLGQKLTWAERRALRRGLLRLVDAFVASNAVDEGDRQLLADAVKRRVELSAPRWQLKLLFWYRHRIGRHI